MGGKSWVAQYKLRRVVKQVGFFLRDETRRTGPCDVRRLFKQLGGGLSVLKMIFKTEMIKGLVQVIMFAFIQYTCQTAAALLVESGPWTGPSR
jgi:hypothetical protein